MILGYPCALCNVFSLVARVGARNAALDFELKKLLRKDFPGKLLQIESTPL